MKTKKYFIEIETNNNENIICVVKSLLNENELKNQLMKMYNTINVFIDKYDYNCKNIIDVLKLKNQCVAKNVFMNTL